MVSSKVGGSMQPLVIGEEIWKNLVKTVEETGTVPVSMQNEKQFIIAPLQDGEELKPAYLLDNPYYRRETV